MQNLGVGSTNHQSSPTTTRIMDPAPIKIILTFQLAEERLGHSHILSLIGGVASTSTGLIGLLAAWRKERCV